MPQLFNAEASPEKRLFISLITRDIGLSDAIVDLLDNSVNAAMLPIRNAFSSTDDFRRLFGRAGISPNVTIKVTFDRNGLTVVDDATGIDFTSAQQEVFRFGHSGDHDAPRDRLSVYGIGMKRALFKIGKEVLITSDHASGGFALDLDVSKWARDSTLPWTLPISKRPPSTETGTKITITSLNPEIRSRLTEKTFEQQLMSKISKVYSFFIGRLVNIYVNAKQVDRTDFDIGQDNFSRDSFRRGNVDCSILAGIAKPSGERFLAQTSGWFVFCNYRTVLYGDKSELTGWGTTLPIFQPKHRPFLGVVLFAAADPESLPWTTTKSGIDVDNAAWLEAKLRMVAAAKPVISFLDKRYTEDGAEIPSSAIAQNSGPAVNVFNAGTKGKTSFAIASNSRKAPITQRVQYDAKIADLNKIRKHFGLMSMSAREIGQKSFDHFLRKVTGEK